MTRGRPVLATFAIAALAVIATAVGAAPPAAATGTVAATSHPADGRRWYRCTLGGSPCGRMFEESTPTGDGGERSRTDLLLRFEREGTTTTATIRSEIEVDAAGAPRRMMLEQALGDEPVLTEWVFESGEVVERRRQGPRTIETRRPRPEGDWHLPGAAFEIARRTATPERPATVRVVDPSRGLDPVTVVYRPTGPASVIVDGGVVAGERWEVVESDGTVTVEIVDAEGRTLASRVSMGAGLGELEIVLADEAAAEAAARGRVELLAAGMVTPTFATAPRRLDRGERARYRLRLPAEVEFPSELVGRPVGRLGGQWIESDDRARGDGVVIVVQVGRGSSAISRPLVGEGVEDAVEDEGGVAVDRHLAATAVLDADDPDVVRFVRRFDRPGRTTRARVEALRAAVCRHISRKGLSTAFATAGETVRSRAGDCTEHAVLLAAALRAAGIPSRTVSGLVWTPRNGVEGGAFLWHMWTQASIDDHWVDFDATLPGGRDFHPGHVAVSVSDGSPRDIERSGRAMLEVFGSLEIEVLPEKVEASP